MKQIVKQAGFTLIEIMLVLAIVSLVVGAGFSTFGAYIDNANQSHTKGNLEVTKRAMLDYVLVNRHMPCPDVPDENGVLDGKEDREGDFQCTANKGTVPYDDIGLGVAVTRDEFNNVFGYGVNTDVTSATNIADSTNSASYFGFRDSITNQGPPLFNLLTPPTSNISTVAESYTVCKKDTTTCSATTASDIEVSSIPAVIVAFNENGSTTNISGCNSGDRGSKEEENCNADLLLWKGYFQDGTHDDQMVTISGYEIKQQVLDLLNNITLNVDSAYTGYDIIVRDDVSNANVTNISTQGDDSIYIDTDDDGNGGNLDISAFGMAGGDDKVHVEVDVTSGAKADMGDGNDYIYVGGYIYGEVDLNKGEDEAYIVGGIQAGGLLDAGQGDDEVTVVGDIAGEVVLGNENDTLIIKGTIISTASIDGGAGNDVLEVDVLKADFDVTQLDHVTGMEYIRYSDNTIEAII
ncbi:MAG: type II secretion system protein [Pseudomonadota bacterium]|nr:type II secretion system protein [Pseudomonadota bacterium]